MMCLLQRFEAVTILDDVRCWLAWIELIRRMRRYQEDASLVRFVGNGIAPATSNSSWMKRNHHGVIVEDYCGIGVLDVAFLLHSWRRYLE